MTAKEYPSETLADGVPTGQGGRFREQWERASFIDDAEVDRLLEMAGQSTPADVHRIIVKAREAKGLSPAEVAVILLTTDEEQLQFLFETAAYIKEKIYGKRVVLFAPLYVSDHCVNNCLYCGYRRDNTFLRQKLSMDEIRAEVRILAGMGHKRLAIEAGEHPGECPIDFVVECLHAIYSMKFGNGSIRRCNVNIAATGVEDYELLKTAGIGTYILFQETYHRLTYAQMHPSGPKSDYDWHTTAHDRAMQAGIDDVGLGVLFGLYDFRFEAMGLILHARHLEQRFGVGPHTVSVPRLRPAPGVDLSRYKHLVNDADFKKLVAVLRLALPYTGMILSTREEPAMRDQLLHCGISQVSAGSCTGVGGYMKEQKAWYPEEGNMPELSQQQQLENSTVPTEKDAPQFTVGDHRSPDEVLQSICRSGWLPSYCTACYRQGRTGDRFMSMAKTGQIQDVCQPNAILTFKEYLLDYATQENRELGEETIKLHMSAIKDEGIRSFLAMSLQRLEAGERDIYL